MDEYDEHQMLAFEEAMHRLKTLKPTTQEELEQLKQGLLRMAEIDMNSTENRRDTQFGGFAQSLIDEMDQLIDAFSGPLPPAKGLDALITDIIKSETLDKQIKMLLAQRAYDLACHVVAHLDNDTAWLMGKGYTPAQIVENDVPDLTELP
jgi:hypothetical protein